MTSYAYDLAGNLESVTSPGARAESYEYDTLGKLIKYVVNGEEKASYKYNGNGQRVEKTVNGAKTKYYWDGANIKNEGTASAVNATNYFGANGVFARKSGSVTNVLYKNGHGDTVLLTRGNSIVRDYDYDAYGAEKGALPSDDDNPFRYSGEYFDSETGFIYLRNRYYDPSSARFISEDTHWNTKNMISGDDEQELTTDAFDIKNEAKGELLNSELQLPENEVITPYANAITQSGNLYPYCMANPVKYQDPEGEVGELAIAAASTTIAPVAAPVIIAVAVVATVVVVVKAVEEVAPKIYEYSPHNTNRSKKNWDKHTKKDLEIRTKHRKNRNGLIGAIKRNDGYETNNRRAYK